jgi:hypothetical protein
MSIVKKFLSSTPVVLLFGLIFLILGFYILFAVLFTIGTYFEISLTIGFIAMNSLIVVKYKKFRKPNLEIYEFHNDSDKQLIKDKLRVWNEEFRMLYLGCAIATLLTVINFWTGLLIAPIMLVVYGSFLITALYMMDKGKINFEQIQVSKLTLPSSVERSLIPRTLVNFFVALVLVAGYWTFQIQKNESELKQDGYSVAAELSNLNSCQSYQSKCVAVDSVKSVYFEKVKNIDGPGKIWKMCFSLNYKYARYGGFYQSDFRYEEFCFNEDLVFGFGWPQYDIEQEITQQLRQELVRW